MKDSLNYGVTSEFVRLLFAHAPSLELEGAISNMGPHVSWQATHELLRRYCSAFSEVDPGWGVRLGVQAAPEARGLYGSLLLNAPTVEDALKAAVEFDGLLQTAYTPVLSQNGNLTELRFEANFKHDTMGSGTPREASDVRFAALLTAIERASQARIKPVAMHVTCGPFELAPDHIALFGDNYVYHAPHTAMVLDTRSLRREIIGADPKLFAHLQDVARGELAARLPGPQIESRVRRVVHRMLERDESVSLNAVARALLVSPRTLQRELCEVGLSFSQVLDGARRERARTLLYDRSMNMLAVALKLGFQDQGSLNRACVRWTGQTPCRFREMLHSGQEG